MASKRVISFREIRALLDCEAKWDFMYSDHLAGSAISPKETTDLLSAGSLWDTAVKTYNRSGSVETTAHVLSLHHAEPEYEKVVALLRRYVSVNKPMETTAVEPFDVPVNGILDITVRPDDGYSDYVNKEPDWFVEYKLRKSLTSIEYLQRDLQTMLYVWAARREGREIKGVIFDETLNEMPAEVRYNKDGRPSRTQTCSADDYLKGCISGGYLPDPDVVSKLEARKIHQRVPIFFESFDLSGVGSMVEAAYARITYLERGILRPSRVRNPLLCRMCPFNGICEHPEPDLVDFLFERKPAKRDRP